LKADRDDELPSSANLSVTVNRFRGNNETLSDIKVYKEPSTTPMVLTWDDPTFTMDSAVKTFNTTLYNLDETKTHSIRVVVEDAYGTADAKIVSIPTVYYTIDFLAGGKEISFGEKATKDDLYSPVTGSSAPTFASDTYYERSVDGVSITYTLLDEEPDDWANTYLNYYILKHSKGLFKCSMDAQFISMIGEIKMWAGNAVPTGWLECDGTEVTIADYPLLYNAIGNLWGTASDTDHFVLPNLMGKVPVGQDTADTSFDAVGETGGSKYIQQHSHSATYTRPSTSSGGSWYFEVTALGARAGSTTLASAGTNTSQSASKNTRYKIANNSNTASGGTSMVDKITHSGHTHPMTGGGVSVGNINTSGLSTGSAGNLQPYAVVKYIICAA
jgi:microcystin-dependent protein